MLPLALVSRKWQMPPTCGVIAFNDDGNSPKSLEKLYVVC
jgi:hypothetical protein